MPLERRVEKYGYGESENDERGHIPLPFSWITGRFNGYGADSCQKAPRIRGYQKESECSIMAAGGLK
ncbi:hypothetical protein LI154_17450 [[Clostridium] scindens]|uniref:hypothetical protein n=1 Tax=Clostridium scindens (strain JCM 10418 / VPI 12708) TaxID=29347 RepID=UPI00156E28FA|nr:hypothetical protein [[Clostridium] scindens]MBS6805910.1 hypothetical protein [Lachnospiraceae bacterium]MCB6647004.1 hypothetical protein [[Clostridium] scindens]NSJ16347.1 hypothetical protein [[Clostridium] scindens]